MPEITPDKDSARFELTRRPGGALTVRRAMLAAASQPPPGTSAVERRDHLSREELLLRVALEYYEMPGLRLTRPQAQRLFGLREDVCARVLDTLVAAELLQRETDDTYVGSSATRVK